MTGGKAGERKLPSPNECISLLQENGCSEDVVRHCIAVAELAVKIARKCGADERLVEVGALLHDIGRCQSHSIDHAVRGAKIVNDLKLPIEIVRMVERHIGAGITRSEAKRFGLQEKDYIPKTLEEKIVSHSDNLMAGTERTSVKRAVGWLVRQGLHDPALKVLKLHEELSARCGMNLDDL